MGIFDDVVTPPSAGGEKKSKSIFEDVLTPPRTGEAAKRGFLGAASFGFLDELEGLAKAGGLDPEDPNVAHAIGALAIGSYKKLRGDPEAQKAYEEQRDKSRELAKSLQEQHPYAFGGGQVAGALAVPIAATARGATLGARAAAGALTGAGVGAATGFGEGEGLQGSTVGAGIGAGVGGAVGAAAPAVVEPVVRGVRALAEPITSRISGAVNPEQQALRRIGLAARSDTRGGAVPGLTQGEFAAEQAAGTPVAAVDRLGPAGQSLARSAANTSPEARGALEQLTQERYAGTGERLSNWLRGQFHYPNADAQQQAILEASRVANRPAYRRAEVEAARAHPGGLWDEGFDQISQAPVVQDAIRKASITGGNRAAREGFTPVGNPFQLDRTTGRMMLRENGPMPTLAFWDEVKKNLDRTGSRDAQGFSQVLREHLDQLVPSYGEARAGAAHFFGQSDMLTAGQEFVGAAQRYGLPETRRALAGATAQERQLFHDGYASRLIEQLDAKGGAARTNMLNRIEQSPAARAELELGLGGRDQLEAFRARIRVESVMGHMRNALGNSTTARQLAEMGLAGGAGAAGGAAVLYDPATYSVPAVLALALRHGNKHINQRVAQRVGELLASNDQSVVERGIQMVARNPTLMRALQAADSNVARIAGSAAPRAAPPLPAGAPAMVASDPQAGPG